MNAGGVDKACKSNAGSWTLVASCWIILIWGNFSNLELYKRANASFPKVYKLVRRWDKDDQKEIGSQLIRVADSIHANIAEGSAKFKRNFARYIGIAIGSCDETISHINDAFNVGLISQETRNVLISEYEIVGKQLTKLKQFLSSN